MYYVPGMLLNRRRLAREPTEPAQKLALDAAVQLRDRKLLVRNSVFSVFLDCVEQRGQRVNDYLSIYPNFSDADGVSGVAILPECDGKFGLIRVYRYPLGSASWEAPRGFKDPVESAPEAALRELREEMGLETTADKLIPLGMIAPEPGVLAARVRLYAALDCAPVNATSFPELGHGDIRFFSPAELASLITYDEIQDPSTLVAYFKISTSGFRT